MKNKVNAAIREFVINNYEWDNFKIVTEVYNFFDLINQEFFEGRLPVPVFSFVKGSPRTMGYYVNGPNQLGIHEQINLNPVHITEDRAILYDTLAHEMAHCWQRNFGAGPRGNYHNRQLREMLDNIGLPCDEKGHGLGMQEPFVSFLKNNGVKAEAGLVPPPVEQPKPRRKKWTCGCTVLWTEPEVKLRAVCEKPRCGNPFRSVEK